MSAALHDTNTTLIRTNTTLIRTTSADNRDIWLLSRFLAAVTFSLLTLA